MSGFLTVYVNVDLRVMRAVNRRGCLRFPVMIAELWHECSCFEMFNNPQTAGSSARASGLKTSLPASEGNGVTRRADNLNRLNRYGGISSAQAPDGGWRHCHPRFSIP